MPIYSLKVQTLVARWKHFRRPKFRNFRGRRSTAMGTVLRVWAQEEVRAVIRAGKFLNTRTTARIWHLWTFISSPTRKKRTSSCQTIQITCWCQARDANMAAWSGSHLLSTGFWEMDFVPRHLPQQRRWLCGKISEVWRNKWIKGHLTVWGYFVAIKWGTLFSDFPSYQWGRNFKGLIV